MLYQPVEKPIGEDHDHIKVRAIGPERELWTEISASGWTNGHPEFIDFFLEFGKISSARSQVSVFSPNSTGSPACRLAVPP